MSKSDLQGPLRAVVADVHTLFRLFTSSVVEGYPCTFETFSSCWQLLHFSFVFQVLALSPTVLDIA